MARSRPDWIVLLSFGLIFCMAFIFEPEWHLPEAHLLCEGEPVKIFESMTACTVDQPPGCPCIRPENPLTTVYWLSVLSILGIGAALLLRSGSLKGAIVMAGAMAAGGVCALFILSRGRSYDAEDWGFGQLAIAAYIAVSLVAFGMARLVQRLFLNRRPKN
jgi:hypothetical protein